MKAEMCEPVLAWLDAGAPHAERAIGFNMAEFVQKEDASDYSRNECGTACCIAGALDIFNQLGVPDGDAQLACAIVGQKVGMTPSQVDELFFGRHPWGAPAFSSLHEITPAVAANAIRTTLETGVVRWGTH